MQLSDRSGIRTVEQVPSSARMSTIICVKLVSIYCWLKLITLISFDNLVTAVQYNNNNSNSNTNNNMTIYKAP